MWVIIVFLHPDGSVKKVKCRLVACGYSQIAERDYDRTDAATLPGPLYRIFCSVIADEDYETDNIDAVKVFTQASLDKELYSDMPLGFRIPGYILWLHMALEGLKQGSHLWFKKNRWAWNKCGMFADPVEPNLYTHETLRIIAGVFGDDVTCGFDASQRGEYLAVRGAYSKLIKIDSPGPDVTVPITDKPFVGLEWERDRQNRTIKLTQRGYIERLATRFKGKFTLNELPYGASRAKRDEFEAFTIGTEEMMIDRGMYLEAVGSIGWPATMTRPELSHTYSVLSSFTMYPLQQHFDACMHAVGYLINTIDIGPVYGGKLRIPLGMSSFPTHFHTNRGLFGVTDSSWGRKPRPNAGHVVMRMNGPCMWKAHVLKAVAMSTAEAETAEASEATKDLVFTKHLMMGIKRPAVGAALLLCDNSALIDLCSKDGVSQRTRYFERCTALVKWAVLRCIMTLMHVPTDEMVADIFTKCLDKDSFLYLRGHLLNTANDSKAGALFLKARRAARSLGDMLSRMGGL